MTSSPPRVLIIGAGSRGNTYSRIIYEQNLGVLAAVAEPNIFKRRTLGRSYVWTTDEPKVGQEFDGWQDFVDYEVRRRNRSEVHESSCKSQGIDTAFICVLDEMHKDVIRALAPLGLHIMCEKPLATTLNDCLTIYKGMSDTEGGPQSALFCIGHVLRYSPVNMLLKQLVAEEEVIGDVVAIEHTEPVGWWHFTHSYVRGNWRNESSTAPTLLTKSCHDIDFILWLLCSSRKSSGEPPHLPSYISSFGSLNLFKKSRKPEAAGAATNCMSCPIEERCLFSAKKLYYEKGLLCGNAKWPVAMVDPEIEDICKTKGFKAAESRLFNKLEDDYNDDMPLAEIRRRSWFGRCVWEADNDVCDDQTVTISWDDERIYSQKLGTHIIRHQKRAMFHMVAFTEKICERRGRLYGTAGEITYDGQRIEIYNFATGQKETHNPLKPKDYDVHGGGDKGLTFQFMTAVDKVKNQGMTIAEAEEEYLGCSLEEIIRSHALVFAAEEARKENKVVDWEKWWAKVNISA